MAPSAARARAARPSGEALRLFAACAPGLEPLVADELRALGLTPAPAPEPGGVSFDGTPDDVARANLWLRCASRVLVRIGAFHARAFGELERRARALPWERLLDGARPPRLRVTCRKSRLYHTAGVAERVAAAIAGRVGGAGGHTLASDDEERDADEAPLVVVRLLHDRCTLSVDSSGPLLHRRGYRLATAKAPLRETLAAALLRVAGWDGRAPLVDPFCGSGTIVIEGALMARDIAPGLGRTFAFQRWPAFDERAWARMVDDARARVRPAAPGPIVGADRDAGAIEAAAANAERAGVRADLSLSRAALSHLAPPPGQGWLVTNPPYGVRVGARGTLRDLYARLGDVARERCAGWTVALLAADVRLAGHARLPLHSVLSTVNGGIRVRVLRGDVPG